MSTPVASTPTPTGTRRLYAAQLLFVGSLAGLAGGAAMALTLGTISEIASEPTFAPGIDSSTWTPFTGIAAFFFGPDAFHGDFHVLPIAFGLALHMLLSIAVGVAGLAFLVYTLGARPTPLSAATLGFAYGLFLQLLAVNAVVNAIQAEQTVYESMPQWGWFAGHAAYGTTLGLVGALLLGARASFR